MGDQKGKKRAKTSSAQSTLTHTIDFSERIKLLEREIAALKLLQGENEQVAQFEGSQGSSQGLIMVPDVEASIGFQSQAAGA